LTTVFPSTERDPDQHAQISALDATHGEFAERTQHQKVWKRTHKNNVIPSNYFCQNFSSLFRKGGLFLQFSSLAILLPY